MPSIDYKSVLESFSGGFFTIDDEYRITYWNKAAEEGTGLKTDEVIGRNIYEVFPNVMGSPLGEKYREALESRTFQTIETSYRDERFQAWFDVRLYPADHGLSVFFQDITDRKRRERQRELHLELSTIINSARHLDELCINAGEKIARMFEVPSRFISIFLYDGGSNEIRLVAPALIDVEFAPEIVHQDVVPTSERLAARIALSKQVAVTDDLRQATVADLVASEGEDIGLRTLIVIPLLVQGELQGVLEVVTITQSDFTGPELGTLTFVANELAGSMSRQRLLDVLRRKNLELESQTLKTQEASDTLKKFLAMFSHELRSPLNSIIGFSDLVNSQFENLSPAAIQEFMRNIQTSGKHLQHIIDDILDLSKIEAGRLELHIASYPVSYFEESVRGVLGAMIAEKEVRLEFSFSAESDELVVDQTRFKQILINLLSNAIKFSRPGSTVRVWSERAGNDMVFHVDDNGIGIRSEDIPELFKPFKQAENGRNFNRTGVGLGLAITRKLVELHGGTIWIDSTPGQGTSVSFRIPIIVDIAAEETAQSEMLIDALRRNNKPLAEEEKPLALIVEDTPQGAELMKMYIESAGYRVAAARDGAEAVEMAKRLRPNVITLDLLMPVKDGWQVMKELKGHPLCRHIPVVIVSIIDEKKLGFSLGAVDYFVKPVNRTDLIAALDRVHVIRKAEEQAPKVLVIDDDKAATGLIQTILENEGYAVVKAHSGREGIEIAVHECPDLIILDVLMPDLSGFEVAEELKHIPTTRPIPIIILTSLELDDMEHARLSQYVTGLMNKGTFTKRDLLREISMLG